MIQDFFRIPAISASSWTSALVSIRDVLTASQAPGHLTDLVSDLQRLNETVRELEGTWSSSRRAASGNPRAKEAHLEVRRAASGLDRALRPWLALTESDPLHEAAATLRNLLFPDGLARFFAAPYEEVAQRLDEHLAALEGPLEPSVCRIRIEPFVARLRGAHSAFVHQLQRSGARVSFEQLSAAQQSRDELLARLI
jgi:hypothetical protein